MTPDEFRKAMMEYQGSQVGGGVADVTKAALPAVESSILGPVGLAVGGVGSLLGAYGQYAEAEKQNELQARQLQHQTNQDAITNAQTADQLKRKNEYDSGDYASKTLEELLKNYGNRNAQIGQ